ncbi:phosphotransferase family protein [Enemella sp. A6]|uniref:phosphotransferase family protein n=1 Tax=Enemella sp. A6 TaxID=3440152 RepID=UPI003EBF21AD
MSEQDAGDRSAMSIQRTARDPHAFVGTLRDWLRTQLPDGADPELTIDEVLTSNGLSSVTVLCTLVWRNGINEVVEPLAVRLCPAADEAPLHGCDELRRHYEVMRVVGELSDLPIPQVHWVEHSGNVVGSPFFCMRRVEGEAPADVRPYTLGDNWLFDGTQEQRAALQEASVEVLAKLHELPDPTEHFSFLEYDTLGETHLARHLAHTKRWYRFAAGDFGPVPVVEEALAWLGEHLPSDDSAVVSWGDARIGNILYHDFTPEAVIDWEMAALGPREIDLLWMVTSHQICQEVAQAKGLPGLPDFMAAEDVLEQYYRFTGYRARHVDWYRVYVSTIWTIVFMRTGWRQVQFGNVPRPDDRRELLYSLPLLTRELARQRR